MDALLIGAVIGSFVIVGLFVVVFCLGRIAGWADTLTEQAQAPEGSLQARVDELRARDAVRVQRTVHAEPIRNTPGGWRAS